MVRLIQQYLKESNLNKTLQTLQVRIATKKLLQNALVLISTHFPWAGRDRCFIEYGGQCGGFLIGHTQWPLGYGVENNSIAEAAR